MKNSSLPRLTSKQVAFCQHFAASGNATQAARLAGYKKPRQQGSENLSKPVILERIKKMTQDIDAQRIATATERQEFWTAIMRDNEIEMKHRLKASEILGKSQGDFIERLHHEGNVTTSTVKIYIPDNGRG